MKQLAILVFLFISGNVLAQAPCDYSVNVTDSIGTYKSTKDHIIWEKNFAGNSSYIFYSLAMTDGLPTLNVQMLQKSKDFMKANCFDKNSKLYLQLFNGKIVTLLHIDQENCGSLIRDDKGYDNRVITASFMFPKGSFEDLKSAPVSMMRIKYLTENEDYILKKEFQSELDNKVYKPENYFINNLKCIE
ncbi:hypothetical protein FQU23_010810 [Flavobacterium sp. XN-5]|uniref:hypothetical protein n=1 Tax=Flavobacterium sp. XN-5 TaxID=2599390 RepID=UPI0011CA023B|nr:hypothetical protein [Flavobacterium sp. XN-5]NGY38001.1 hypothetical protein [Flavobacterium sp. XN-5]